MKVIKKILLPLFSVFLAYRSIDLIRSLIATNPDDYTVIQVLTLAFLLSIFITGIFAFIGFAYSSSKILPSAYYRVKSPVFLSHIYRILGVKYFNFFLLFAFWGRKNNSKKYFDGTKKGLTNFIYQTKQSEFGHFCAFVLILGLTIYLLFYEYYILCLITTFINIIGNLYPVVLQRYHRMRIERISNRFTL